MREVNYILQNISNSSLVIIDELGRGTSAEEGVGLCYAICEQLLATSSYVFLATHFLELNNLAELYHNVEKCVVCVCVCIFIDMLTFTAATILS